MKWDGGLLEGVNVALDVFILSIVMCGLREMTGSIWAGVVLHMMKNGLAFYLLFINTALLSTMGG
jgi:membrane protease YdiL (CAAX protease family)